jgi:hypothetical protein
MKNEKNTEMTDIPLAPGDGTKMAVAQPARNTHVTFRMEEVIP